MVDVTSPPPVIYHPINPPVPMIHPNVNQKQLQIQAKIHDKPVASKTSNLQKSLVPNSEDPIIIESEPKKSRNSDVILLSSPDDETEKKRQRKRLSDASNFVSYDSGLAKTLLNILAHVEKAKIRRKIEHKFSRFERKYSKG